MKKLSPARNLRLSPPRNPPSILASISMPSVMNIIAPASARTSSPGARLRMTACMSSPMISCVDHFSAAPLTVLRVRGLDGFGRLPFRRFDGLLTGSDSRGCRCTVGRRVPSPDSVYSARSVASGFFRSTSALASTPIAPTSTIVSSAPTASTSGAGCHSMSEDEAAGRPAQAERAERADDAGEQAERAVFERQRRAEQARAGAERAQDGRLVDALELGHRDGADQDQDAAGQRDRRRRSRSPASRCRARPGSSP